MTKYRKEMEELGMVIPNVIYCVALLTCSNLEESTKMSIENVAKNSSEDDQNDPTTLEHTMRKFTESSE